jgi:hypothetical protein
MNGYVAAGYGVAFGTLLLYSWRVLFRARALRRAVGPTRDHGGAP